jgi:hypothetical protein
MSKKTRAGFLWSCSTSVALPYPCKNAMTKAPLCLSMIICKVLKAMTESCSDLISVTVKLRDGVLMEVLPDYGVLTGDPARGSVIRMVIHLSKLFKEECCRWRTASPCTSSELSVLKRYELMSV